METTNTNRQLKFKSLVPFHPDKLKESLAFQKPKYCCHKIGNTGTCSNFATRQVKLCSRKEQLDDVHLKVEYSYRCEEHKNSGTVSRKVFESNEFDQSYAIQKVNEFLTSIIGLVVKSKFHTAIGLEVKYKKSNGGVMCFQPVTGKWKYVYFHQIKELYHPYELIDSGQALTLNK